MRYLLTTDPGLEDVAAEELSAMRPDAATVAAPYACPGLVRVELDAGDPLLQLTTVHHVAALRGEAEVRTLAELEQCVATFDFPELVDAASFRVTAERRGEHEFSSVDIQRAAGAVLHRRYGTPVDLEGYEVDVRICLIGNRLFAGSRITRTSLGKRIRRAGTLRSALKPTVAAAMLRLLGAHEGPGRLLDPMCGTGTIPIEAARINPRLEIAASDWDPATIELARRTLANHELEIEVREADARSLDAAYPQRFDYIVTDPPYGVRQAKRISRSRLYGALLRSFESVLAESGRIALVILKYHSFTSALGESGLEIVHERRVELGSIAPRIVVLGRKGSSRRREDR
jgi:tRNA (guanine6-N2)-methyltransferase